LIRTTLLIVKLLLSFITHIARKSNVLNVCLVRK